MNYIKIIETYILLFFLYSFLGWIWEVIINIVRKRKFINRGFFIGPYCPIYGYGVLLIIILLKKYQDDLIITFIMSILIAGGLEYYTSFVMEKMFNARWWDYTYKKFNINGRICLNVLILFGILACLIVYFINPFFIQFISIFKEPFIHILTGALVVGYIIDNVTSFKIMINLKDVSRTLKDNTEEMSKKVRNILSNKSRLYKRLVYAFPNIDTKVKLKEWKQRLNSRIHEIKLPTPKRRRRHDDIKIKIKNIIINEKAKYTKSKK